jgi:hypothetical protein
MSAGGRSRTCWTVMSRRPGPPRLGQPFGVIGEQSVEVEGEFGGDGRAEQQPRVERPQHPVEDFVGCGRLLPAPARALQELGEIARHKASV